jgi:hypothetical protein
VGASGRFARFGSTTIRSARPPNSSRRAAPLPRPATTTARRLAAFVQRRAGLLAIVALGIACGTVMQGGGWAQTAFYAQVRAFSAGTPEIDRWHWETKDKSYFDGHFYSVKAPGLPGLLLPWYAALDGLGAKEWAREAADRARADGAHRWASTAYPGPEEFGYVPLRRVAVGSAVEHSAPMFWALSLLGSVVPAVLLLLLVRWAGNRLANGLGTAAALTAGTGTLLLPFSTVLFSHVASACLGFAAFALLWREREGPPRLALLGAAGVLAGLAVTFEYPLALAGAILGLFAIARGFDRSAAAERGRRAVTVARRGLAYAGGVIVGVAPLLAYNVWAFGSPFHMSYEGAVAEQGFTGHDELGLNDGALIGQAAELLFANRGLITITPVVAMGFAGAVLAWRRGWRAEAAVLGGLPLVYLLYNSGYWLPFGGGSPGPRFLIPALPYLGAGLALTYRRFPATTLGLAIPSAVFMVAATLTNPLIGDRDTGLWANLIGDGYFEHSVLTALGVGNGIASVVPFAVFAIAAVALTALATPRLDLHDLWLALGVIPLWAVVSLLGPAAVGNPVTPLDSPAARTLIAVGAGAAVLVLLALKLAGRVRRAEPARPVSTRAVLDEV